MTVIRVKDDFCHEWNAEQLIDDSNRKFLHSRVNYQKLVSEEESLCKEFAKRNLTRVTMAAKNTSHKD